MPKRSPSRRRRAPRIVALAALALLLLAAALAALWLTLPDPAPLARTNPATTALVEQRRAEARARKRPFALRQSWVGLDRVSPALLDAVLLSEDANFFGHAGIDWDAVRAAAEHDLKERRFARGASTLTQQLAKNLWFGTEKSLWRKVKEALLAAKLERALSKRRILALYVNVAEWGDGVFGIEAGARHRFGTSAAGLSPAQAAVMASMLPAPLRTDLGRPSTWLKRRSRRLLDRMHASGRLGDEAHRHASAELERILAGPVPADDRDEPPEEEEALSAPPASTSSSTETSPLAPSPRPSPPADAGGEGGVAATPTATPTAPEPPPPLPAPEAAPAARPQ